MMEKIANGPALVVATFCFSGMVFAEPKMAPAHVEALSRQEPAVNANKYRGMGGAAPVIKDVPDHAEELEQERANKTSLGEDATLEPRAPEDTMN